MVTEEQILDALRVIQDPDFQQDIVTLNFVKNIKISDSHVSLDIELTTPACPIKAEFQRQAEAALMAIDGVETINVNMTSQKPKIQNKANGLAGVKNIILVASCKGGVGKSTVAASLANELVRRNFKTGLLDADLFGPSVPTLFDIHKPEIYGTADNMIYPYEHGNLKMMSFGFLMSDGAAVMRGPMVAGYIKQVLNQVLWEELDYLIIDMPPGTGDIQLTITQDLQVSGAVIVTTPQSLSLVDVQRGIEMFETVKVPMLGIVENMSYFVCDGCDKEHYIFGKEPAISLENRYGLKTLKRLPMDPRYARSVVTGESSDDIKEMTDSIVMAQGKISKENRSQPTVQLTDKEIHISWEDGKSYTIENRTLRVNCKCARCIDEYTGEKLLNPDTVPQDVKGTEATPLGNYAVKVVWSDGHDSGIYTYKLIENLTANS